jgi:hypothetical protein
LSLINQLSAERTDQDDDINPAPDISSDDLGDAPAATEED